MAGEQLRIGRRSVLAGVAATGLGMPPVARAAQKISLKYGTNVPVTNPLNVRLQEAFDRINKETEGAVEILLFPSVGRILRFSRPVPRSLNCLP